MWASTTALLLAAIRFARATTEGVGTDLSALTTGPPSSLRSLVAVLTEAAAVLVPIVVIVLLIRRRRWRRLGIIALAAALAVGAIALVDLAVTLPDPVAGALPADRWVGPRRFPNVPFLAAVTAVAAVGSPWLSRSWRRAARVTVGLLLLSMAVTGTAAIPTLFLAVAVGAACGAACLVVFGAPNRRPAPAEVAVALDAAGHPVVDLRLIRADGGRAQLYEADLRGVLDLPEGREPLGDAAFAKVYSVDSRDADVLYRWTRTALLRGPNDDPPVSSLPHLVDHEALLLMLARRAGVQCPRVHGVVALSGGSMLLLMERVDGSRLDTLDGTPPDEELLDAVWSEVRTLHRARLAHRSLRAANVLVADRCPTLIDLGFGRDAADERALAVDRAELLASLSPLVGEAAAVASAVRVLGAEPVAAAAPYVQPLALTAGTRRSVSKKGLEALRREIAEQTGSEPEPLEQLVRVKPRTVVTVAALSLAFYVLLPQLANVGDSLRALRSASWSWVALVLALSIAGYLASAISLAGGVPQRLPMVANTGAQFASSFVNRLTPANVGGMALNVRFLQKAGVDPAQAVTGMSLNVLAGAVVHAVLLALFLVWAGRSSGSGGFSLPSSSTLLVVIAALLALGGLVALSTKGRRLFRTRVLAFLARGWRSLTVLARSPAKLAALFGGSMGVTLSYVGALYASVAAFGGGTSLADVGAVYLGSSVVATAAPTPGGLGAMEAALVAGLTAVGLESGVAVAAVLTYRLITYWLPILPGWLSFQALEHRNLI